MKETCSQRRVTEPPKVRHEANAVHMHMLDRNQLEKPQLSVRAAKTALLNSAPWSLGQCVGVNNFINHHRARVNFFSESLSACDVSGPHTSCQAVDTFIRQRERFHV